MLKQTEGSSDTNNEAWLTSLSDLMMLLVVFFVIQIAPEAILSAKAEDQKKALDKAVKELKKYVKEQKLESMIDIVKLGNNATVNFKNTFVSGGATLKPEQVETFDSIVKKITPLSDTHEIRIEGHTDDIPIKTEEFSSNWELSSARSLAVLDLFIKHNYFQPHLSSQGFAEFRPLLPHFDEKGVRLPENQAKNRRIKIRIEGTDRPEICVQN